MMDLDRCEPPTAVPVLRDFFFYFRFSRVLNYLDSRELIFLPTSKLGRARIEMLRELKRTFLTLSLGSVRAQ
jgi:hypothetical protein